MTKRNPASPQGSSRSSKSKLPPAERAYQSALRILSRRDHSELELRKKLQTRYEDTSAIAEAMRRVREHGYLKDPKELAEMVTRDQRRRGRGQFRINRELERRGLPSLAPDPEAELDKCREIYKRRFGQTNGLSPEDRVKAYRYLTYRGFDSETIRTVLNSREDS